MQEGTLKLVDEVECGSLGALFQVVRDGIIDVQACLFSRDDDLRLHLFTPRVTAFWPELRTLSRRPSK